MWAGEISSLYNMITLRMVSIKRIYAQYAHCQTIEIELNQTVTRGQRVGLVGGTNGKVGSNFDNHLHFELRTTNLKADAWPPSISLTTVEAVSQHYTHPLEFIRTHRPFYTWHIDRACTFKL